MESLTPRVPTPSREPVGILGGGQLALMLAESAHRLGLKPIPLAASSEDPAARLCPDTVYGSWEDPVALHRFFSQVRTVVFENEFVSCEALEVAARGLEIRFVPELGSLFQLQDKLRQKEILTRLRIPTAPYEAMPRGEESAKWVRRMLEKFGGECVIKWAQLGYDGKGTWISPQPTVGAAHAASGAEARLVAEAVKFCEEAAARGVPVYAERKVAFRRELAIVACHSVHGEFAAYPLVISQQKGGVCRLVTGPASALGVPKHLEPAAQRYARRIAETLPIHGTFAIEMFETQDGDLWVNELAPRVHNSGHFTQDAAQTSQFENHWRAVLGLPLGDVTCSPGFAMLNLLGPPGISREAAGTSLPAGSSRVHLHWYGKSEIRPGRKLGHLNGSVLDASEVPNLVRELEACEVNWKGQRW